MKTSILLTGLVLFGMSLSAQKYSAKNGYVGFFSHTPIEDIKADNNQVNSILDSSTGDIVFLILNKSFHFEKAMMEEHFNENYIESEKFAKSNFKGKITNISDVKFGVIGVYNVTVTGEMNMHGITKPLTASGTLEVLADGILAKAKFNITPEDYGIEIPGVVRDNIAKEMEVTVNVKYAPLNK